MPLSNYYIIMLRLMFPKDKGMRLASALAPSVESHQGVGGQNSVGSIGVRGPFC